ncbi:MAG: YdiU family protein [Planctomycetes bacterium]|nr:YdiU family protein [Planctomycetota bacterium]
MTPPFPDAGWRFDNSYARLPESLFEPAPPVPVQRPGLLVFNEPLAADLGIDGGILRAAGAAMFVGNELPPGAEPIAQAYAGHQFGHFTNLGDGRAILLGEHLTPDGRRVDLQLKGGGRTRYSRGGDGRAAEGPMLREYIISEAMHALGIPTTRSLAVASTGEWVRRETPLPGAVLTRVAASHIRVGTFQYAAAVGEPGLLQALLDHAIARHAPAATSADDPAVAFLEHVVEQQASLVAKWMHVGFVHGVMNTDNMAVSGETIDYGPCAFLDTYDPAAVFSSIDQQGRYAYGNQPSIAHWNLVRLAEALLAAVRGNEETAIAAVRGVLETFSARYERHYLAGARAKLGLTVAEEGDRRLFDDLLGLLAATGGDFTTTFAGLAAIAESGTSPAADAADAAFHEWYGRWLARLTREPGGRVGAVAVMRGSNPVVIPRNHRVEEALAAAAAGDRTMLERLLAVLRDPYVETAANEPYRGGPPSGCGRYRTFCGT